MIHHDQVHVSADPISEDETRVTIASGANRENVFFQAVISSNVVNAWIKDKNLAGHVMQVFMESHPAAIIVNNLMPLLDGITHTDHAKVMDVINFKQNAIDLLRQLGYIK